MITVNLFDTNSQHLFNWLGEWEMSIIPSLSVSDKIKYVHKKQSFDGVTIISDSYLYNYEFVKTIQSKYKVGWLVENVNVTSAKTAYYEFEKYKDDYVFTMTHDQELLDKYPNNTRFFALAYSWVKPHNVKIHTKTKNASMLYSHKLTTVGHAVRHEVGDLKLPKLDLYGRGQKDKDGNPRWDLALVDKEDAFKDYRFTVAIENYSANNYFTEKLIDCFLTGTVPIYWGCPNVSDFFDIRGIVKVNTVEEIVEAVNTLTEDDYNRMIPYVQKNYELAQKYTYLEDQIYELIKDLK